MFRTTHAASALSAFRLSSTLAIAILGIGLTAPFATAQDQYGASSEGKVQDNVIKGGNAPRAAGKYRLQSYAYDSKAGAADSKDSKAKEYKGTAKNVKTDNRKSSRAADRYKAEALAQINENGPGVWNSKGSYATVTPKAQQGAETANSHAFINDPWSFDVSPVAFTFTDEMTFGAGLSIQALAGSKELTNASITAGASTTLNNLGRLWSFSWTTISSDPGHPELTFWTNPALGLNDSQITSEMLADMSSNSSTGLSSFTKDFSFSFDLTVPANTQPTFSSEASFEADAAAAQTPEPSPLPLSALGILLISTGGFFRKVGRQPSAGR